MSCCCSCFSCLKCCGSNCCGCCDNPRDKKHKHLDDDYTKFQPNGPANVGYQAPVAMMAGGGGQPQFASFEVGPNGHAVAPKVVPVNDDALPPMPSWETASKKRVMTAEEEKEGMELGDLDPSTGQKMPLMSGAVPMSTAASPGAYSPAPSPYSELPVHGHDYMSAGAMGAGGAMGGAAMMGSGRGSPKDPYARGPGSNGYRGPGSAGMSPYSQPASPAYGQDTARGQYAPYSDQQSQNPNMSPAAYGAAGFGNPRPGMLNRQMTGGSNASGSQFSPSGPPRQYSQAAPSYHTNAPSSVGGGRSPYGGYTQPVDRNPSGGVSMPSPEAHRVASPPIQNNSGFDFGGGNNSSGAPPPFRGDGGRGYQPYGGGQQQQQRW